MRYFGLAAISALLFCFNAPAPSAASEWPIEAMNKQVEATNFLVNLGCSGTLIDVEKRLVLTAEHCIREQYETIERERVKDDGTVVKEKIRRVKPGQVSQLSFADALEVRNVIYRSKLLLADRETDLAVLEIVAKEIPHKLAAPIACEGPRRGDPVTVVGNPYGDLYSSVSRAHVASLDRSYPLIGIEGHGDNAFVQIMPGLIGGHSGGANGGV